MFFNKTKSAIFCSAQRRAFFYRTTAGIIFFFFFLLVSFVPQQTWAQNRLPEFHPNQVKYHESGQARPATGRSGSAVLYLRALMGKEKDGGRSTDIEVRTNDFESVEPPPGNIVGLQVKAFDGQHNPLLTKKYNRLAGTGTQKLTVEGLERGETVQVQANIRGVDPRRTDVVTVQTTVKFRPDLVVTQVDAPDTAVAGSPVNISATLIERNGDVGARANCRLLVDREESDSAPDVWVDAGGTVSCAFTHVFDSPGDKLLEVTAENIDPSDYDTSNNSANTQITVTDPDSRERKFWYSALVADFEFESAAKLYETATFETRDPSSSSGEVESESYIEGRGWYQQIAFHGRTPDKWTFPIDKVSVSVSLDGETLSSASYTDLPANFTYTEDIRFDNGSSFQSYTVKATCAYLWESACWISLCHSDYASGNNKLSWSDIDYIRYSGDVTYHSEGWWRYRDNLNGVEYSGYYSWNSESGSKTGPPRLSLTPTSVFDFKSAIVDDDRSYQAEPVINSIKPREWSVEAPKTCYSSSYDYEYHFLSTDEWMSGHIDSTTCYELSSWYKGVFGWAAGQTGPKY